MTHSVEPVADDYARSGVDSDRGEVFLQNLLSSVKQTLAFRPGIGRSVLDIGYYAAVLDIGRGLGLALTTDGVGTKILIAEMMEKYDTIGIDCVAMNVNDLICVNAEPIALLDYLAVQDVDPRVGEELGRGLLEGARQAEISIPGGELAQLRDMLKGVKEGSGLDLAGSAYGLVELRDVNVGAGIQDGDVLIGLASTGLHSNGYSLARRVMFDMAKLSLDAKLDDMKVTLGEALLAPTHIYVKEWKALRDRHVKMNAILNITGDGLFNLGRVAAPVGFVIDHLPPPPPIFEHIQAFGKLTHAEMYKVFNMGIGFCFVVPEREVSDALSVLSRFPMKASVIGRCVADREKKISIPALRLLGKDDHFFEV
jgi:phosphoribosylformylglycinamidine cyclo-ligase